MDGRHAASNGFPVVVLSRDAVLAAHLRDACAPGVRIACAASGYEAAAEVLFGEAEAGGASPVRVPGTAVEAR